MHATSGAACPVVTPLCPLPQRAALHNESRRQPDPCAACPQDSSGSLDRGEVSKLAQSLGKPLSEEELSAAMKQLDTSGDGTVDYAEFAAFWKAKFGGQVVAGTKLAAIMAQWTDLGEVPGVAYHPDRYVDADDEFRARVWFTFEKIDSNGDHQISYIEFIKYAHISQSVACTAVPHPGACLPQLVEASG